MDIWNTIVSWSRNRTERNKLLREWNDAARTAFIAGTAQTLLKAEISRGDKEYRHQFSNRLNSGFRIYAFYGRTLSKDELTNIGAEVVSDNALVRRLVVLGFDTLEVCGDVGEYGCRWQLTNYMMWDK